MNYTQSGSYTAIVGLVVAALGHFGVLASADQLGAIVGGVVAIWGIIAQFIAHRKLAQTAGAIPK